MHEVMTKVAKAIELLKATVEEHRLTMDLGVIKSIYNTIQLLQSGLDKLCEESK